MIAVGIFLGSVCFVAYVVIGYPALLALLARSRAKLVRKASIQPSVSVVIAVYNGELFIADKLTSVLALDYPQELLEILVVSDGSIDRTAEIVRSFASRGVKLLEVERAGKPAALNAAIPQTHGEILLLTDVRQVLAPDSLRYLAACFADETVGVASGELVIRQRKDLEEANVGLYWRYETWIRNNLSAIDSIFGATGPFYSMRRSLAVPIPADQLLDDVYLPLHAFFQGYRLIVESRARAFDYPTTIQAEFKRKVRTLAGNYQIMRAYPGLLGPANRMWFHFVSYKLARLLLAYALFAAFVAGLFLPGLSALLVTAAQLAFYLAALSDPWLPARFPLKRLTSPARTFLALVLAAVVALRVFFVPPRKLWKETKIVLRPQGR